MSNRAFAKGYDDYYDNKSPNENFYDYEQSLAEFNAWCEGYEFAYIEAEGK